MTDEWRWLIGLAVTVGVALIGAFRNLAGRIAATHDKIDEVKDKYVRRDDLEGHLSRIDASLRETREEMREHHKQLLDELRRP